MAKYSQNQSCGQTCPWGAADNLPLDAFTLAAMKAARRRETAPMASPQGEGSGQHGQHGQHGQPEPETEMKMDSIRSQKASRNKTQDVEGKMMELLQKCLDKKVIELELKRPEVKQVQPLKPVKPVKRDVDVRSSCSSCSSKTSRSQRSLCNENGQKNEKNSAQESAGYEALDRYPALLREVNGLTDKAITQGLTSTGKQKQAMKLSDASLGKFDADQSRIAYLQMQKSAAEARKKNRSALTFGDEPSVSKSSPKEVTMAGKRAQAQKLSDASLGKFDVDQSQVAFLEMHNTAAEMRNKNRVGQGIF